MGFALHCHVLSSQIFLVTVWHWELFMLPLFLLLLIGWHYFHLSAGMTSSNQDLVSDQCREPFRLYVVTLFQCQFSLYVDLIFLAHVGLIYSVVNEQVCNCMSVF